MHVIVLYCHPPWIFIICSKVFYFYHSTISLSFIFYSLRSSWRCIIFPIDIYLLGTVMLVFGMGLYELFISNLDKVKSMSGETAPNRSNLFGMFILKVSLRNAKNVIMSYIIVSILRSTCTTLFLVLYVVRFCFLVLFPWCSWEFSAPCWCN